MSDVEIVESYSICQAITQSSSRARRSVLKYRFILIQLFNLNSITHSSLARCYFEFACTRRVPPPVIRVHSRCNYGGGQWRAKGVSGGNFAICLIARGRSLPRVFVGRFFVCRAATSRNYLGDKRRRRRRTDSSQFGMHV